MCVDGPNFGEVAWQQNRGQCHAADMDMSLRRMLAEPKSTVIPVEAMANPELCAGCNDGKHECWSGAAKAPDGKKCRCSECLPF